jgi:NAD(P)-dependent dehydrogenase (short-subunit alcohol dehydrogenase family)
MDANDKVFLVVGAASGIGRSAAQRWAAAGGLVAAVDIDAAGLATTASGIEGIHTEQVDVTDRRGVNAVVERVEARLGPIECVYNGAAIQPTGLLLEQDPDEIKRVMDINYGGFVNVSLATLPRLLDRGRGSLINFASMAGWVPNMHFGAYGASKFACVGFTEVLYHENRGKGVHIACVCPPQVDTPLRQQAKSNPKVMQTGPAPMSTAKVLDAVERAIDRRVFWVFPGAHARAGWWLRRWLPSLLWKIDHRAEGL